MSIFNRRPPYEPDLIDIHDYQAEALFALDRGSTLGPPPPIPGLAGREWTCEELEAMRKNRRLADDIYDRYKVRRDD